MSNVSFSPPQRLPHTSPTTRCHIQERRQESRERIEAGGPVIASVLSAACLTALPMLIHQHAPPSPSPIPITDLMSCSLLTAGRLIAVMDHEKGKHTSRTHHSAWHRRNRLGGIRATDQCQVVASSRTQNSITTELSSRSFICYPGYSV